jgi:sulfoxide reductase heme-binding subunit YedZ
MPARLWQWVARILSAIVGHRFFKPAVFVACLVPGLWLGLRLWRFVARGEVTALGVDPNATLMHETGQTALFLVLAALSVTPIRRVFKVNRIQRVRRMLGVWAFSYALVHLSLYLVFDQLCYSLATCDLEATWQDILKRRFIFAGMFAFSILLALAITSTNGWMRRLRRNWQRLHRLVYVAATAGIVHFIWIQKSDLTRPFRWGAVLALLLGLRLYFSLQNRWVRASAPPAGAARSVDVPAPSGRETAR